MKTKNSLPVVMSFIADFLSAQKQQTVNNEQELAELLSQPLNTLRLRDLSKLCEKLNGFCECNKVINSLIKFPDLFTFDELARYYALDENICRIPPRERLILQWVKETGVNEAIFLAASVDSSIITRCQAISLCEISEELTGRVILADNRTPMQYLGAEATFSDIIDYFTVGSKKIDDIRYKIFKISPENKQMYLNKFYTVALRTYAMNCGKEDMNDEELAVFAEELVHTCKLPDFCGPQDWDLPIWWTEDQLNVQISGKLDWITPATKVSELIDAFVEAKGKKI